MYRKIHPKYHLFVLPDYIIIYFVDLRKASKNDQLEKMSPAGENIRKFTRMDFICALHLKYDFNRTNALQHYTVNIKTYSCLNPKIMVFLPDSLAFSILKYMKSSSF